MSLRRRRRLAILVCRAVQRALPPRLESWGWAIRREVDEIGDDTAALLFGLDSLRGLAPRIAAFHLLRPFVAPNDGASPSSGGTNDMALDRAIHPRAVGIACATGAVLLGLAYMASAGAPSHYLGVNAGALVVGLVALALIGRVRLPAWGSGLATLAMALVLLATAMLGNRVDGAARWVELGPLFIQPSLVLLPVMVLAFSRAPGALSLLGTMIAAAALAFQPDRAMAGMLAAGLVVLAVLRPDGFSIAACVASLTSFVATSLRADSLPAAPYVDQILYSSFDIHLLAGLAVLAGSALLVVPAFVGRRDHGGQRQVYPVFGIVWLAVIVAAALGNYPTPVLGYGGSAILGYLLSLAMLPRVAEAAVSGQPPLVVEDSDLEAEHLRVTLASPVSGPERRRPAPRLSPASLPLPPARAAAGGP